MIDVHFAIDFFDGTRSQLWDEAEIEAHLDEFVTLDDPMECAVAIGAAEIFDSLPSAVLRLLPVLLRCSCRAVRTTTG